MVFFFLIRIYDSEACKEALSFSFNAFRRGCCEFMATAEVIEGVHNLLESFHDGSLVDPGKTLCCPLVCDSSPNIGHWTKASIEVSSWIFLKDGKPAFL
jgi:hypothetical protein